MIKRPEEANRLIFCTAMRRKQLKYLKMSTKISSRIAGPTSGFSNRNVRTLYARMSQGLEP